MTNSKLKTKLIVGNWKMHGSLAGNALLLNALAAGAAELNASTRAAVCVPFPYLAQAQTLLQQSCVAWGAQDISLHLAGAYTGEVAGPMVAEFWRQLRDCWAFGAALISSRKQRASGH